MLDKQKREGLLFDDDEFSYSKRYFEALQLLRISREWIEETQIDLHSWIDRMLEQNFGLDSVDMVSLQRRHEEKCKSLLRQIEEKRIMVTSLRDGVTRPCLLQGHMLTPLQLYNATAVREARTGTKLADINTRLARTVLIFTVMTILYLPATFVTVCANHTYTHHFNFLPFTKFILLELLRDAFVRQRNTCRYTACIWHRVLNYSICYLRHRRSGILLVHGSRAETKTENERKSGRESKSGLFKRIPAHPRHSKQSNL